MSYDDSYYIDAAKSVRASPYPAPTGRGDWWFRRWTVTAPSLEGAGDFVMPAPVREAEIVASVVVVESGEIVVELGERQKDLSVDALTYAAIIVSELRCRLGVETAVDGDREHTLFLLVKWDCGHSSASD
jgi:hypothetical protein